MFLYILILVFISPDEVHPGDRGYGITAFRHNRIDTFQVEIIDVIPRAFPRDKHIVLARIWGRRVDTTGVAAGMSGSPIFIHGKLLGALAYAWEFAKEAICGITPITESMESIGLQQGTDLKGMGLSPYNLPLVATGLVPEVIDSLANVFTYPIVTDVTGKVEGDSIFTGSPIGVLLVDGDARLGAVGTCTYYEDGKLWAFGHPFLGAGDIQLPITTARIHYVLPSLSVSHKIASLGNVIGVTHWDGIMGIYGVLDEPPDWLIMDVTIDDDTFHYKIVQWRHIISTFVPMLMYNSILMKQPSRDELTYHAELQISMPDDTIRVALMEVGTPLTFAKKVAGLIDMIEYNPYIIPHISRMKVDCRILHDILRASIDDVTGGLTPQGDTLELLVRLQIYNGDMEYKRIAIPIPQHIDISKLNIEIGNASIWQMRQLDSWTTLLHELENIPAGNALVTQLQYEMTPLPQRFVHLAPTANQRTSLILQQYELTPYHIEGRVSGKLTPHGVFIKGGQ